MASMISGDMVEAYVRKNACKEEMRRTEASTASADVAAQGEKKAGDNGASSEKKAAEGAAGSKGEGGSLFGLLKKKVHPKAGEA